MQHADANVRGLYGLPLKLIKRMKHKHDRDLKLKEPPYKYNKEILDALPSSKRMIKSKVCSIIFSFYRGSYKSCHVLLNYYR